MMKFHEFANALYESSSSKQLLFGKLTFLPGHQPRYLINQHYPQDTRASRPKQVVLSNTFLGHYFNAPPNGLVQITPDKYFLDAIGILDTVKTLFILSLMTSDQQKYLAVCINPQNINFYQNAPQFNTLLPQHLQIEADPKAEISGEEIFARERFNMPFPCITFDQSRFIHSMNPAAETLLDVSIQAAHQTGLENWLDFLTPGFDEHTESNPHLAKTGFLKLCQEGHTERINYFKVNHHPKASLYTLYLQVTNTQDELQPDKQMLTALLQLSGIAILAVDLNWNAQCLNQSWEELTGLTEAESGKLQWLSVFHAAERETLMDKIHQSVKQENQYQTTCRIIKPLGEIRWVQISVQPLVIQGTISGFLISLLDVDQQHRANEQLRILSEQDPLTSLANRTSFLKHLEGALLRVSRRGPLALFFVDLDSFKQINDTFGHAAGDEVLITVSKRLLEKVRKEDLVARLGGDEFVVVMEGMSQICFVQDMADLLIEKLSEPILFEGHDIRLTASIGISIGSNKNTQLNELLKQADVAVYRAKSIGRNNAQLYTHALDMQTRKRMEMFTKLYCALDKEEFVLYYQPQLSFSDGQIMGFEALLRWKNDGVIVGPYQFCPLLEESGLIRDVGEWVLRNAVETISSLLDQQYLAPETTLSVNVSSRQFTSSRIIDMLPDLFESHRLPKENLILEITESQLIQSHDRVSAMLNDIRQFGCRISLDDFGTGYSALRYLVDFPIDQLKIDKSFTDLERDLKTKIVTEQIIHLAKALDLEIVVEGIDSEAKHDYFRNLDCGLAQGYYYAKPMPVDELTLWITKHNRQLIEKA